ncbi:hypothetical protein D3C76_1104260 [compost metagenome]
MPFLRLLLELPDHRSNVPAVPIMARDPFQGQAIHVVQQKFMRALWGGAGHGVDWII